MITFRLFLLTTLMLCVAISCKGPNWEEFNIPTPDWTEITHGNQSKPNYEVVFSQDQVNTIEIRMTATDWQRIRTDMQSKFNFDFGSGGENLSVDGNHSGAPFSFYTGEPIYVAVSIKFKNKEWYKVGFRLKGYSSLMNIWRKGIYKLPFRLDFDAFEEEFPTIQNQRFYGFKELSFSPGYSDPSLIREKITADIFREAGIPAAQTAFYRVCIDFGEGLKYCGIYTLVEVIEGTMVEHQFGKAGGNIYKPESTFQQFAQRLFEKKNNREANDYSDVKSAISSLHRADHTTHAAQWRADLEQHFNVDHFLKWLAVNTTIVNWDTYGNLAHNYYLYNEPGKGLTWIPWDHNMSMTGQGFSLSLSEVTNDWPLIRYLIEDPVYQERYKTYVKAFTENLFTTARMNQLFEKNHSLISPYVTGTTEAEQKGYTLLSSVTAFNSSLASLKHHVLARNQAVQEYLK